jgi:hypothetical protein
MPDYPRFAPRKNYWDNRMMLKDPIVDEIRRIREKQAAKHGFEVKAILADARMRQRRSNQRVVSFVQPTAVKVLK